MQKVLQNEQSSPRPHFTRDVLQVLASLKAGQILTPSVRVQTRQTGKLLNSGYLSMERLPDGDDFVSCRSDSNIDTNMVGYTECFGSRKVFVMLSIYTGRLSTLSPIFC